MRQKDFWSSYSLFKQWMDNEHISDSNLVILNILVLIIKGETRPEVLWNTALSTNRITEILFISAKDAGIQTTGLSKSAYALLTYWIHTLPKDTSILAEFYEKISSNRKSKGIYYTPQQVIHFILTNTLSAEKILANPYLKILDPACGCGNFLLAFYDYLFTVYTQNRVLLQDKYPQLIWSDFNIHKHIVEENLWGADIDPIAVDITTVSLLLKANLLSKSYINSNIFVLDTLVRPDKLTDSETIFAFKNQLYDYVIGNPPYLSFGIRGTGKWNDQYKEYLCKNYPDSAEYKISYYALFLQRGIELLKKGGHLGFILPDSFLNGRYYSKIRKYILQYTNIHIIALLSTSVFKNAATGYSTICILKKRELGSPVCTLSKMYQIFSLSQLESCYPNFQYKQDYFNHTPFYRFRIFFDSETKNLIDHMDRIGRPMKEFCAGHTGIRSLTRQKDIVKTSYPTEGNWKRGLVSGKQVLRYQLHYLGHWIHIHPDLLYKGGWNPSIVSKRKILLRQTSDTIIACIDDQQLYHLNNIHSFVLQNNTVTLEYLLLLLNSRLFSFYYHAISMERGRAMAQIDIETIELLPVVVDEELNKNAPLLTLEMTSLLNSSVKESNHQQIHSLEEQLNQKIYELYQLTKEQISLIETTESK